MSRPIPSTTNVYIPGTGITITRANIELEQMRRLDDRQPAATPEEIIQAFCTPAERSNWKNFTQSNRYNKLVARATRLMRKPKKVKK